MDDGDLVGGLDIIKEELESDPDFLKAYSVNKSAGPATPDQQARSTVPAA